MSSTRVSEDEVEDEVVTAGASDSGELADGVELPPVGPYAEGDTLAGVRRSWQVRRRLVVLRRRTRQGLVLTVLLLLVAIGLIAQTGQGAGSCTTNRVGSGSVRPFRAAHRGGCAQWHPSGRCDPHRSPAGRCGWGDHSSRPIPSSSDIRSLRRSLVGDRSGPPSSGGSISRFRAIPATRR